MDPLTFHRYYNYISITILLPTNVHSGYACSLWWMSGGVPLFIKNTPSTTNALSKHRQNPVQHKGIKRAAGQPCISRPWGSLKPPEPCLWNPHTMKQSGDTELKQKHSNGCSGQSDPCGMLINRNKSGILHIRMLEMPEEAKALRFP